MKIATIAEIARDRRNSAAASQNQTCCGPRITKTKLPGICADEHGLGSGLVDKKDVEFLMENASHSHEFKWGTRAQPVGTAVRCGANRSQEGPPCLAFGPRVGAEGRTE